METSIDRIRAKIAELEARIADLRIAERELEALDAAPVRTKPKAKAKRKPTTDDASKAPQTVGAAIAEVLSRSGALPLAELAEQMRTAGREARRPVPICTLRGRDAFQSDIPRRAGALEAT
jgi:hypothetical protein